VTNYKLIEKLALITANEALIPSKQKPTELLM